MNFGSISFDISVVISGDKEILLMFAIAHDSHIISEMSGEVVDYVIIGDSSGNKSTLVLNVKNGSYCKSIVRSMVNGGMCYWMSIGLND